MAPKLSRHLFTKSWDVHAWIGVLGGLVLHLMFLTGAITLFRPQLEIWEEPLAQVSRPSPRRSLEEEVVAALESLPEPPSAYTIHPPDRAHGATRIAFAPPGERRMRESLIHPRTLELLPRRERLSVFVYGLHFLWHESMTALFYVAGLLSAALLLSLATGVLIHLKDLVRQFHQFRPLSKPRVFWSDMHKVLGVMGLPFQAFYAYSGALIVLAPLVVQAMLGPVFGGDRPRAIEVAWDLHASPAREPGAPSEALSLDTLVARAGEAASFIDIEEIRVRHHGHTNGVVDVRGVGSVGSFARVSVRLRESDGAVLDVRSPSTERATGALWRWVYGLHFVQFGGLAAHALFALLALATCATILTGNRIWLARREATRSGRGHRVLAKLTNGVGAGSLVALAALFFASRALPLDLPGRGSMEEWISLAALALSIAWAFLARRETWRNQLELAGALLVATPFLATRWSNAGLFGDRSLAAVVGVDVALLCAGAALCVSGASGRRERA
jgi:uncharacterized iron-regulated membrane protein